MNDRPKFGDKDLPPEVIVANEDPVPVTVAEVDTVAQSSARETAALAAVDARIKTSYGQRRVNLIWEITQALIAIMVTATTLFVAANLALKGDVTGAAFLLLSNAFFLVVGFYFGRTNHQRTGGVGPDEVGR